MKTLLDGGASVDATNRVNVTALWMASYNGHAAVSECLLYRKADHTIKGGHGEASSTTALEIARRQNHTECTKRVEMYILDHTTTPTSGGGEVHSLLDNSLEELESWIQDADLDGEGGAEAAATGISGEEIDGSDFWTISRMGTVRPSLSADDAHLVTKLEAARTKAGWLVAVPGWVSPRERQTLGPIGGGGSTGSHPGL